MNNHEQLESALRSHPLTAPVRPNLRAATLQLAVQAQRARAVDRTLAALLIIAAALFALKWLGNDLGYLIQLSLTHFQQVQTHGPLYVQAIWESLPKVPLLAFLLLIAFWFAWRRLETFLIAGRKTSTKQGIVMKLVKLTPRLAIATGALGVTALGFSGYAVAQKVQQHKLEILRQSVNATGRTELATNGDAATCAAHPWSNETASFEVKKGVQLSTADAEHIVRAACLQVQAETTASKLFHPNSSGEGTPIYQFVSRHDGRLSLASSYGGKSQSVSDQVLAADVKVYDLAKDAVAGLDALKPGAIIMPVINYPDVVGPQGQVASPRMEIGVIIILPSDPAITWYDPSKLNQVARIRTCEGNPQDRCTPRASIDFFPSGGGEANTINPALTANRDLPTKEISGTITEITATSTTIKSSSGRLFQVNFGSNPAAEFNRARSQYYQNEQVTVGDTLFVRYVEAAGEHDTTIAQSRIFNAQLAIEFIGKSDPIKKY